MKTTVTLSEYEIMHAIMDYLAAKGQKVKSITFSYDPGTDAPNDAGEGVTARAEVETDRTAT